ncbi:MAG: NAD-binding protein [Anaerolineales bacterium]|nr:NAD-binding protein [Anaerolineales bacterium]
MKMIVIGCGRVGAELAHRLYQNEHTVVVVDRSETAFQNLPAGFRGRTVVGEAMSQDTLHRAGIEEADGVAVVTSSDSINAVVAHLARTAWAVPSVVVRNFDSRWRSIHEAFGLQVISSSSWAAQRIEELLYHQEAHTVFSAGNGEVELYEFTIRDEWAGRPLAELLPGEECVLAALTRYGRAMLPDCTIVLQKGDVLLVSATLESSQALRRRLQSGLAQETEKGEG